MWLVVLGVKAGVEFTDGLAEFLDLRLQARDLRATLRRVQLLLHMLGFLGQPLGRLVETRGVQMTDGFAEVLQALLRRDLFRMLHRAALALGALWAGREFRFELVDAALQFFRALLVSALGCREGPAPPRWLGSVSSCLRLGGTGTGKQKGNGATDPSEEEANLGG